MNEIAYWPDKWTSEALEGYGDEVEAIGKRVVAWRGGDPDVSLPELFDRAR